MSEAKRKHRSAGVCRRCGVVINRSVHIRVRAGSKYCLDHRADLLLRRAKASGFEQVGDVIDFDTFFSLTMEAYMPAIEKLNEMMLAPVRLPDERPTADPRTQGR